MANDASTVVECLATDPEIKGLNPATAWYWDKMAEKIFLANAMARGASTVLE
jgi:hypothetical protein